MTVWHERGVRREKLDWFYAIDPRSLLQTAIYALNVSLSTQESIDTIAQDLGPLLLGLAQAVRHELALQEPRSG